MRWGIVLTRTSSHSILFAYMREFVNRAIVWAADRPGPACKIYERQYKQTGDGSKGGPTGCRKRVVRNNNTINHASHAVPFSASGRSVFGNALMNFSCYYTLGMVCRNLRGLTEHSTFTRVSQRSHGSQRCRSHSWNWKIPFYDVLPALLGSFVTLKFCFIGIICSLYISSLDRTWEMECITIIQHFKQSLLWGGEILFWHVGYGFRSWDLISIAQRLYFFSYTFWLKN